jgi:hypothetical protein
MASLRAFRFREKLQSAAFGILVAVFGAILVGALTSFGQQYLPPAVNSLANSAGGWCMFAYLLVWLGRARPVLAAILGALVFELFNVSYAITSTLRGYPSNIVSVWTFVALVAGPIIGAGASLTRYGKPFWRVLGVVPLSLILATEGVYSLATVAGSTGTTYWIIQIALSGAFFAIAIAVVKQESAFHRKNRSTTLPNEPCAEAGDNRN